MDYLKTIVPSQLIAERGANLVVINPGSANLRIGLASQEEPITVPHCIARRVKLAEGERPRLTLKDQPLNAEVTPSQHSEREKAYDIIASLLKIPFLDEEAAHNSYLNKTGRLDGHISTRTDSTFAWTNVMEKATGVSVAQACHASELLGKDIEMESTGKPEFFGGGEPGPSKYREFICGEEALKISPTEPYCLCNPIRRGRFNVSQHYSAQQVVEDIYAIWDWVLNEKLHVSPADRKSCSVVLVMPETFDSREIKEVLSIVLRDLGFASAVVHQEGLAAAFGNGLSNACVVNLGAQVTSVICIEDGVALPSTAVTLPFGGEDISRCLLWIQKNHQTWPNIHTNPLEKPADLLMLNKIKESYCHIREGEFDAVALVQSFEEDMPVGSHKSRLSALNVPTMGLFFPKLLIPEQYPPPSRTWFHDYEDMLDEIWHMDFPRRPENSDGMFPGTSNGLNMWDNYPVYPTRSKREVVMGLAEAITNSILSAGRIELQRKLFCSIQLIGGVALTGGLVAAVEERVLHSIPSNEAIDTVEVLRSRSGHSIISWKGGVILGILDFGRETWVYQEDWIRNGIHLGSGKKYKDSYYLQAQAMSYIAS